MQYFVVPPTFGGQTPPFVLLVREGDRPVSGPAPPASFPSPCRKRSQPRRFSLSGGVDGTHPASARRYSVAHTLSGAVGWLIKRQSKSPRAKP